MTDVPSPPPAAAPPAPAKPSAVPKILIGCLAVLLILGVVVAGGLWWVGHKIKGYAENPAAMVARVVVAGNPELEIVSEDNDRKTVTIRNTKTGDVITMNAEELQQGKLKFKNEKGEEVTFDGSGAKDKGALTVTTKEGTAVIGGGDAASLPAWLPTFPGAKPQGVMAKKGATGEGGVFTFQSAKPAAAVLDFYQSQLEGKGFKVERTGADGGVASLVGKAEQEKREVTVVAIPAGDGAQVNVQYSAKAP